MDLSTIGNLIIIAIKNFFWWLVDIVTKILIAFIDWVASLLPDYTIPVPSVLFGNNHVVPALNWIFPVDHFIVCLTIIVTNMGIVFVYGPLLRIVRISR